MNEKAIPFRQIEPGVIITQGRGGQAVIQDAAGNIFLTTQNKTGSNQTTLSVSDSISSILISNGETSSIIETRSPFSSNNFNTINFNPISVSQIQVIKPIFPSPQSLDVTVDILPTSSVTSSVQTQIVEEPKSNKEIELSFLPESEDIIFSPLYDYNILGLEAESYSFLENNFTPLNITTSEENKTIVKPPTILSNDKETEDIIKAILQGLNIPINTATVNFIKAWRQAEGGNATWNLLNSSKPFRNSTKFNKFNVQNYKSKEDGIEANILTLKLPKYSRIIEGLKKINSLNDGYNLAVQLSDGPSNGPFYVWSLGYYDRIQKLCARGNKNYICPPPLSIKNEYIAKILNFWNKNNKINFTNFIKKPK
jgi:hypothetical protein